MVSTDPVLARLRDEARAFDLVTRFHRLLGELARAGEPVDSASVLQRFAELLSRASGGAAVVVLRASGAGRLSTGWEPVALFPRGGPVPEVEISDDSHIASGWELLPCPLPGPFLEEDAGERPGLLAVARAPHRWLSHSTVRVAIVEALRTQLGLAVASRQARDRAEALEELLKALHRVPVSEVGDLRRILRRLIDLIRRPAADGEQKPLELFSRTRAVVEALQAAEGLEEADGEALAAALDCTGDLQPAADLLAREIGLLLLPLGTSFDLLLAIVDPVEAELDP